MSTLLAPDFPGGGQIICDRNALKQVYATGRGGIKVRARYSYDQSANCIDVTSIPPTTTCEAIIEKSSTGKAGQAEGDCGYPG